MRQTYYPSRVGLNIRCVLAVIVMHRVARVVGHIWTLTALAGAWGMTGDREDQVDLSEAKGVQVGDGNVQHNYFAPVYQQHSPEIAAGTASALRERLPELRQLPRDIVHFTGRSHQLASLDSLLADVLGKGATV